MQKKNDEHSTINFLKFLYQHCNGDFINVRFLPSAKNLFIPLSEIESIPAVLEAHKGQNAYFGVATRIDNDGTKAGILQIPALWVDLDVYKLTDEKKEEGRQRYRGFPLKATVVIDSGGGRYLFWMLKESAPKEDIPRVEDLLDRLASYFNGDMASTDASHILRIPGSLNHKYQHTPQVIIKEFHPERRYNIDDFDFLPEVKETPNGEKKSYLPEGWEKELLEGVEEGERNNAITRLTGRYLGRGLSRDEILPILLDANSRFKPPLPLKEIERVLDSMIGTHRRNHPENKTERQHDGSGHHFSLIPAANLVSMAEDETDWIWEGVLPSGGLSLVVAKPKVGKTTLAFNLAVALSRGDDFLGKRTRQATVVYLALEEKRGELQRSLSKLGVTDEPLYFHFGPAPVEAMKEVEPLIRETGAKFLVIDILQKFCRVKDLNDYAQVTRALEPLMATARALNCHIQLLHHAGKRDREDGDDILGSTGLLGGVDTSIHIKKRDKRRTLFTIQRYGDDLPETVVILRADGSLEATGSREQVEVDETIPLVVDALSQGAQTINEIWDAVLKRHDLISKAIRSLLDRGDIRRSGSGKKGDPFRYEKNSIIPSPVYMGEGGKEFFSGDNSPESKENFLPRDFPKNGGFGEGMGKAFSAKKKEENDLTQGGLFEVMDDGQLTY